nr:hemerythrin family protein [uncultured Cupriavidus sp.]
MNESPGFTWHDDFSIDHRAMDDTHREFVECVNDLLNVADVELGTALRRFIEHAHRHFAEEDDAMRDTAYGSSGCHVDEHAAVLQSAADVQAMLEKGRPDVVRAFARALADWFPEHVRIMDQGLARWLIQRQLGGAPIKLQPRRALAL